MASIFKKKGRGSYIIAYFNAAGRRREKSSRSTDYKVAERIAAKLDGDTALRREGLIDPKTDGYAAADRKPLSEHLGDFHRALLAKGTGKDHADLVVSRARRVVELAGITAITGLQPSLVLDAIRTVREDGASLQTAHHYVRAIKQLSRWLYRDGRAGSYALEHLQGFNAASDRRHERRAFTDDELNALLAATESGPSVLGIIGADRAMLYRVAVSTGFRARELASLKPASFDLDGDPPTISVKAAYSKRRRDDVQPVRGDVAELIRPWLADKVAGCTVFNVPEKTAKMLRKDLRTGRHRWIKAIQNRSERRKRQETPFLTYRDDAGRVLDFHALRHTYVTRLVTSGASVKVCQELARHSTPTLTIGRYAHVRIHDLSAALDGLPCVNGEPSPSGP